MSAPARRRLALATTVWRRHELTAVVLEHHRRLRKAVADRIDLTLLAAGSEGLESRSLCERNGFVYVETPNQPVSFKWNRIVREARSRDPEGVILVNSDDLISTDLPEAYLKRLAGGTDFFGLGETYVFDLASNQLGVWPGYGASHMRYRVGEPAGCARCFSRRLLDATDWKLWPSAPAKSSSMDFWCTRFLKLFGFEPEAPTMKELGVHAVQIKTDVNITSFERLPLRDRRCASSAWGSLEELFGSDTAAALQRVRRKLALPRMDPAVTEARRAEYANREPVFRLEDLRPQELRDRILVELETMRRGVLAEYDLPVRREPP